MNGIAAYESSKNRETGCADLMVMAERELSAFFNAVTDLFETEQAGISAEDWLHELIEIDGLPDSAREWRSMTVRVSARLATRVNTLSRPNEFIHA